MKRLSLVGSGRADRTALLAAIADLDAAQREKSAPRETLDRLQAVVDRADDAARAAAGAQRAAEEARKRWISGGCEYSAALEHHALVERAAELTRAAEHAAADARAVSREAQRAEEAIRQAESQVRDCEGGISSKIANVIFEEQKLKIARLEAILAELPEAWLDVLAVDEFFDPWRRSSDGLRSDQAHAQVAPVLQRGAAGLRLLCKEISSYSGHLLYEGLDQRKALLREGAAQLRADPNA
jgi:hypothetical protein